MATDIYYLRTHIDFACLLKIPETITYTNCFKNRIDACDTKTNCHNTIFRK